MSRPLLLALLASSALIPAAVSAQTLPTGGSVQAGAATIGAPTGGAMTITQTSDRAVIDWHSFSIGEGGRVDIAQPGSGSALLNRVTGTTSSTIAGQLSANGQVYLVNPNGILVTRTGSVNAAGFVASTLDLTDKQFMAGDIVVTGRGGTVANRGTIAIVKGGYAALIGGKVDNAGTILAPLGRVALGAGTRATLDLAGDGFLQVALPQADGGIAMSGRIVANGGAVLLSAAQAVDAARATVNLSGTIEARGVASHNGAVTLTGGDIALTGAGIDVSGASGGGSVRIGGDAQGRGTLAHADTLSVDAASTIRADATGSGDGGSVVLWSDARTAFAGTISARGAGTGAGGAAEVSGKALLAYTGTTDLTGARFGTLLLDPYNVTISTGADSNQSGFAATGNDSVINAATLTTALGTANVTVSTGAAGSAGGQQGNITLATGTPLSWNTGATLTLQAAGAVTLNSAISAAAGGLTIGAGTATSSSATADISVARFTLATGRWVQNAATLPGFGTADFRIDGNGFGGSFLRAAGGAGTAASPYLLADIYGVQGIASSTTLLAASYRLANNIDASGTAAWNGGAGFAPVGGALPFTGALDGAGNTISGLFINRPSDSFAALIGRAGGGSTISNLALVDARISGSGYMGGLIGRNEGGSITRASFAGTLSGDSYTGGLVGYQAGGSISQSFVAGNVTSSGAYVGGLVGFADSGSSITQSHASGSVAGSGPYTGGLVGFNRDGAIISQSYAINSVAGGGTYTGGLAGFNGGSITQAYASGNVTGGSFVGGVSGGGLGTVTNTYWDTQTTGRNNGVGLGSSAGTTALTTAQARTSAAYTGFDFTTVWYQAADLRPILRSEAATAVGGVIPISNLHQLQLMGANLAGSYVLTGDIDASATASTAAASGIFGAGGFVPVGNSATPFLGSLNGARHTVSGLTIVRPTLGVVGLIGYLGVAGSVSGIGLTGSSVSGGSIVGGLVGNSFGAVSQSYATGAVSGTDHVGGLVGVSRGVITQSYATAAVTGTEEVGGLAGLAYGTLTQSYATGSVSGTDYVGGLVGFATATISQIYASGSVTGSTNVGGLFGYANGSTITANYWDTQTTGRSNGVGIGPAAGTGLTTAQARTAASYTGFDFTNVWYQAGDNRPILRSEAAAAVGGVIPISNLHQLQLMDANLAGSYRLTGNIDASATNSTAASAGIWGAGGFVPVGTGTAFTGSLDGAGYAVSGLVINRPTIVGVGLIGQMAGPATVSNIGVLGGSVLGYNFVGALVGYNVSGSVSRSYATTSVSGGYAVGGLVGGNGGSVGQSYATGRVANPDISDGEGFGGLVGSNGGSISQSYATGEVYDYSGYSAGGLVGYNGGSISQSYATGTVGGLTYIGGLVGSNVGYTSTISESYAVGSVDGTQYLGGVVGFVDSGTVTNTYWDTTTSGRSEAFGSGDIGGAVGRTTAQMQDLTAFRTNYAGFDFATVWSPPNQVGQNNGSTTAYYPQLYALANVVAVTPGTTRTYGGATPPATYVGVQAGDYVTTLGSLTGVTASSDVGTYAVTGSGTGVTSVAGRVYRAVYVPGQLTITPATISVAGATGVDKVYDTTSALPGGSTGFTASGVLFGDAVTVSAASAAYDSADAGSRSVLVSGLALSGAKAGNYVLSDNSVTGAGTITPATITVAGATGVDKTYDGTTALPGGAVGYTFSGVLAADAGQVTVGAGNAAYDSANAGSRAVLVSGLTLSGARAANYVLAGTSITGSGTIGAATLVYTADPASRIYGATNPPLTGTVSGFVPGQDQASATTGTLSFSTGATATSGIGSYAVTGGGLSANNGNYVFVQAPANATALTITQRPLTVAADAQARAYGDANPALTYTVGGNGLVNGDTLSGSLATQATATSPIGAYAITQGNLAASANYALSYVGANLTIGQRAVTVTADAKSRLYGDANPALTYITTSLGAGTAINGALATDATTASSVGSYAITQGSITAAANPNYALSYVGANLTVGQRALLVTADPLSRLYGDATPARSTATSATLVNGDTIASVALMTPATATSNVGAYDLTASDAIGTGLGNYAITYATRTNGLTIAQRPVTVTADAQSRAYGDANPALTYTVGGAGLANGDTLDGALATSATPASGVGAYGIDQGNLGNANYAISYTRATLTVTPRALTISASDRAKTYGDTLTLGTTGFTTGAGQLVNGDGVTGVTLTSPGAAATAPVLAGGYGIAVSAAMGSGLTNYAVTYVPGVLTVAQRPLTVLPDAVSRIYGDANPASGTATANGLVNGDTVTRVALATPATVTSAVGGYALTGSAAVGSGLGNYAISYATRADGLTVTPRPITIAADAQTRVYGDADPALTYQVGGAGLANGDSLSGRLATDTTDGSGIGGYAITQGSLAASSNYQVSYTGALLTIAPRPLTITADDQVRLVGEANPPLTFTLGGRGLVNGDTLTGMLATTATQVSPQGRYAITQGSLAASINYAVTFTPGALIVGASRIVPLGELAGTLVRDSFATDTRPVDDKRRLMDARDSGLPANGSPASAGAFLASPDHAVQIICPRQDVCTTNMPPSGRR